MKKILGLVCIGVGMFLLVAGLVAVNWAEPRVEKTPLDVASITRLAGTADRIDTENGGTDTFDVRAISSNRADSDKSSDDVVVFASYTCLVKDVPDTPDCGKPGTGDDADPNVVNISDPFVFAADRVTAEAVAVDELPETAGVEGLVNKWPFGARKTDYEVWDGLLGRSVTATYESEEELEGLPTYVYRLSVTDEPAEVIDGVDGLYSQEKTYWVEPTTGTIVKQTQDETRTTADGDVLLDLQLSFTEDQVSANVADTEDSVGSLNLITRTVPILGYAVGIPLILIGLVLLMLSRSSGGRRADSSKA